MVKTPQEAEKAAKEILGMTLITHQTVPSGRIVRKVLIEEGLEIKEELYLGIVIDRSRACPVIMASREGGVEIEKIAAETPEKIVKVFVDPLTGLGTELAWDLWIAGEDPRARRYNRPATIVLAELDGLDAVGAFHGPDVA